MITISEAKKISLKKWELIKKDCDHGVLELNSSGQPLDRKYGECGFCARHTKESYIGCINCELYKIEACSGRANYRTIYWQFIQALYDGDYSLARIMVDNMIMAIESIEDTENK
jgi:hypothetical protein